MHNISHVVLLLVLTAPATLAEELPAMSMTGMRVDPITQTTAALEMTGMATSPTTINVTPPQPKKK